MTAKPKSAPSAPSARLAADDLDRLAADVVRRVEERGAASRSELDVPKGVLALVSSRLSAAGLELKPKLVRVSLETQLLRRLSRGSFPLRGLEREIAGATRAEARAALGKLVTAKRAIVLRGDGEGDVSAPAADVLTAADRARIAAVVKALAALAKPPGKAPLAARARWADVMELVDDVFGRDGVSGAVPPPVPASQPVPAARGVLEDALLARLQSTRDPSGIASIATAARMVTPNPSAAALGIALRALAARGDIELRIASQPHLLAPGERELCPTDPAGRVLAYARLVAG